MNVQIQTVHFDADQKLIDHIEKKVEKLKTFHDRIVSVEVSLILEHVSEKVKDKVVHIKVNIPKTALFAKHESKIFEESFEHAFDSVVSQIKKHKEKLTA
ncbi:ribosome-associated translation inhibitor RaiA [Taibaiella sp. KBW10]|uniref:ribosome hibernation-promoting factor, HPF/YfiA family n=1 Tax=Taibaiella sp. KBW10 TaxID=2153357 RepID=UPI000F5A6C6E|nr:ribosome-associated translation inhibitor RaiA [Taibaiella sp. KBW10]RQO31992.1 ribosome-associated translation inhibitor RaiA [Taibaiella sp. KBW10]